MEAARRVAGIEAGGTKFVCAIGREDSSLIEHRLVLPTSSDPALVLKQTCEWIAGTAGHISAIGVASFGPIDLHSNSSKYGFITETPKPGWRNTDLIGSVRSAFPDIPIGFDTDVNGAALGEHIFGSAMGVDDFVYITIGTGIGGGGMSGGNLIHGSMHPEMGHILIPPVDGDTFEGTCPYHGRCWEGLCSGPAILKRTGLDPEHLPADHPAWEIVTTCTARALANITLTLSPRKIIIGGSVRHAGQLGQARFFELLRQKTLNELSGYLAPHLNSASIENFIVPPRLDDNSGVIGAMALASNALKNHDVVHPE